MATVSKTIQTALKNSSNGRVRATHQRIMAELRLSGCTRRDLDDALASLQQGRKIRVKRTETHITISAR